MAPVEDLNPFVMYPPQEGTHPDHPMWVRIEGGGWLRLVDMANVVRGQGNWVLKFLAQDNPAMKLHISTVAGHDDEGNPRPHQYHDGAALAYVDREFPPPPPRARVGQVWVVVEEGGIAELAITCIMRFGDDRTPAVILPSVEPTPKGVIVVNQTVPWEPPPANAIMVRDFDGPKVWTPPFWEHP